MKTTPALLLNNHRRRNGVVEPLEARIAPAGAGALDLTFGGGDGIATVDHFLRQLIENGEAMAVQADGKILIAGSATDGGGRFYPDLLLVRLNANGTPDLSFGTEGQVTLDFGGDYYSREEAFAVVVQSDGKILVGGRSALTTTDVEPIDFDFALARFTTAGVVDAGFGSGGFVRTNMGSQSDAVRGLAISAGGLIYAVGDSGGDAAVARYTSAGVLDIAFDGDGKIVRDLGGADSLRGAVVQSDSKLVAAGTTGRDFAAVRFTTTGALDATFGTAGVALVDFGDTSEEARALALDATGKIVLGGGVKVGAANDFALARLTTAGVLDTTFGTGGKFTFNVSSMPTSGGIERIEGVAIQADGKIVVAGTAPGDFNRSQWHAARVSATGALDAGYGTGGVVRLGLDVATFGRAAGAALSGGALIIAGTQQSDNALQSYSLRTMKLTTSGLLDTAFDGDGVALFDAQGSTDNSPSSSTVLADGSIFLVEELRVTPRNSLAGAKIALTHLLADGTRDPAFGKNGTAVIDLGLAASRANAVLQQPDGKILLAGTRFYLPSPDGVLAGEAALARLMADGSLDTSFANAGIATDRLSTEQFNLDTNFADMVLQPDGKIVVLANGTNYFTDFKVAVSRYNANGTLDTSFAGDGRAELAVQSGQNSITELELLNDGKLLLAGENDTHKLQLVRLLTSGGLDGTFGVGGVKVFDIVGEFTGVVENGDGSLRVGVSRDTGSSFRPLVLGVATNGSLAPSFGNGGIITSNVHLANPAGEFAQDAAGRYLFSVIDFTTLGVATPMVIRLGANGQRDETFGPDAGANLSDLHPAYVLDLAPRPDGSLLVIGGTTSPSDTFVAQYTGDPVAPAEGLLGFTTRASLVNESEGGAQVFVARIGGSAGTVTVNFSITGGTAQAGSDFTTISGTLTFGPGVLTQQISLPITVDTIGELGETVELTLATATGGAVLQNPSKHVITILPHNGGLGTLDPNFGVNGVALSDHGSSTGNGFDIEQITDMAYAPNGDIIAVGTAGFGSDFFLSRFHADGSPDLSFGDRGRATTDLSLSLDKAESVGVLPDGRILVAGYGTVPAFGASVHFNGTQESIGGADEKQLVLARYLADGSLDRSYGENGFVVLDPRSLPGRVGVTTEVIYEDYVILPTGEVVAGIIVYDFLSSMGEIKQVQGALIRFRADGSFDTSFGGDGLAEGSVAAEVHGGVSVAQQADGKFVLAYGTGDYQDALEEKIVVARFTANGARDTTFGTGGVVQVNAFVGEESTETPTSISFQQDGKILLGGHYQVSGNDGQDNTDVAARDDSGFVVRLNANGSLDTTFSTDGIVLYHGLTPRPSVNQTGSEAAIYDVAQLPSGKIAAVAKSFKGSVTPVVVELLADGTFDPQFGINGSLQLTAIKTDSLFSILDAALLVTPSNEILAGFGGKLTSESSANSQFTLQRITTQGAAGRFEWSLAASETEESDGFASLIVQRIGGTLGAANVSYSFTSGTAAVGADFIAINGTLTFQEGETSQEILVPITVGDAVENVETFTATLANPTGGATLGAKTTHTVSILDGPDRFEFSSPVINFLEGSQFVSVQVLRKGGAAVQASVDYTLRGIEAINGVDFDALEFGTLRFVSGQRVATISFALRADNLVEGREGIALTLLNPLGGPVLGKFSTATASIYDSEPGKGLNAGALDSGFGNGGIAADLFSGTSEQARGVVTLPDGKLLVVGESGGHRSDFVLARYLADGTLDTTFGVGGTVTTDFFGAADSARSVALDTRGRIVVAGWALRDGRADFAVARYLANGTLDSSFDADGRATVDFSGLDDRAAALAFTDDDRIVLAGSTSGVQKFDMAVAVLLENGTLDTTFSGDGRATVDFDGKQDMANAVLVQPDGAVVLGGTSSLIFRTGSVKDFALVRLTPTGALDTKFSGDGKLLANDNFTTGASTQTTLNTMLLRDDGRIIFGGSNGGDILLGEISPAGNLTFYTNDNFSLAQLGGGPTITSSTETINDLAFAPDGKLVALGHTIFPGETTQRLFVKRYESDFRFDANFGVSSVSVLPTLGSGRALAFAEDGNIVTVGGAFEVAQILKNSAAPKEGAFALNAPAYVIAENGGSLTVTVSRPHETSYGVVSVDYAVVGISAQPGQDYMPVAGTLTFRETETVKTFTIPILNDVLKEGTELFGVLLANPTGGAQLSSASYATVAIPANDSTAVTKGFSFGDGFDDFVFEGFASVTVNRTGSSLGAVSVDYHTEDGTAKAGEDYTPTFGTISFAAGETSKQIFIITTADDLVEGTETFYLKFSTPTGGSALPLGFQTMTLSMPDGTSNEAFPFAGNADVTFDTDGRTTTDSGVTAGGDNFFATAQQADGKLVSVGQAGSSGGFFIARHNADGSPDTTFGAGGKTITSLGSEHEELALGVRIQPDGKILVIGANTADGKREEIVLTRYTTAGALDASFGIVRTQIQNNLALYLTQGNGDVEVGPDGNFIVAAFSRNGTDINLGLMRFLPTGKLDTTFGTGGTLTYDLGFSDDFPKGVTVQPDGKIIATFASGSARAVRFNADGSVDSAFGDDGVVSANPAATLLSPGLVYTDTATLQDAVVLPDGDIILLGQAFGFAKPAASPLFFTESLTGGLLMLRYHADGSPDVSFGTNGVKEVVGTSLGELRDAVVDEAGKIVVLGGNGFARVLPDGRADSGFGPKGVGASGFGSDLLMQANGRVVIAGGNAFGAGDARLDRFIGGPVAGAFRLNWLTAKVSESGGSLMIPVERIAGLDGAVSVTFTAVNGTAVAGSDFTATTQVLSWGDREEGVKTVSIPITNDFLADANEMFTFTLSNATGGALLSPTRSTGTATIIDEDQPGVLAFSSPAFSALENAGTATFTVRRTDGNLGAISASYSVTGGTAVAGQDFTAFSGTVNFATGEIEKTISVSLINNFAIGEDKTIIVTLTGPLGGATLGDVPSARLTIMNDETPNGGVFGFGATLLETREDSGGYLVTVLRTGGSNGSASVSLSASAGTARDGLDFIPFTTTLFFSDGQTSASAFVPVFDDFDVNGERTVFLTLNAPSGELVLTTLTEPTIGADGSATLSILDNDAFPVRLSPGSFQFLSTATSAGEQSGSIPLIVLRTDGAAGAASVLVSFSAGSAKATRDFDATPILVEFANGEISKTILVPLRNDYLGESSEAFSATLGSPTGGATLGTLTSATLTIIDDEGCPLADFNGDGNLDLVITKGAKFFLHLGDGNGGFGAGTLLPAVKGGKEFLTADFTGDGNADVVIMSASKKSIFLLRGEGDGTFETPQAFLSGKAKKTLITADFNGDGRLDLAALQSKGVNVLLNNGDGFGSPITLSAGKSLGALVAGDFTGDGRTDLAVTNGGLKPAIAVLPGKGTEGFGAPLISRLGKSTPGLKATSVVAGDFDGDGKLDLAGIISKNRFALFTGIGEGRFGTNDIVSAPKGAKFIVTSDFEDDLDLDLAATAAKKSVSAVTNSGSGRFTPGTLVPTNFAPTKFYACDLDGDEDADLVFTNNKDKFKVLLGSAGATFIDPLVTARIAAVIAGDAPI